LVRFINKNQILFIYNQLKMINQSIDEYISHLIGHFKADEPTQLMDIVLDGGLFNGSYQVGAMYFIKKMEEQKRVKVCRLSGCSIGSIVAFLYLIDRLESIYEFYDICRTHFQTHHNFEFLLNLKHFLSEYIPKDVCDRVNNRLFISYNNVKTGEKHVRSKYRDVDDVIDTIIRSCYLPYFIDGKLAYKNKYVDGMTPYLFKKKKDKKQRILYLDLFGFDKIGSFYSIRNEASNHHRVLYGLLDIHWFFIKEQNTQMCSYVNNWGYMNNCFYGTKRIAERIIINVTFLLLLCKKHMSKNAAYEAVCEMARQILLVIIKKCML